MPQGSLEQEAMDRVRRMYASFDNRPKTARPPVRPPEKPAAEHQSPPSEQPEPLPEKPAVPKTMLDVFFKDKDQSLILLLLVLLMKDGADMNLMLALMYMLL